MGESMPAPGVPANPNSFDDTTNFGIDYWSGLLVDLNVALKVQKGAGNFAQAGSITAEIVQAQSSLVTLQQAISGLNMTLGSDLPPRW